MFEEDLIIFITGTTATGKSTLAKNLLNEFKNSLWLEEYDIIREAIRKYSDNISNILQIYIKDSNLKSQIDNELKLELLNKSTSSLEYSQILEQSDILIEPLISICKRLIRKRIPCIIEGTNLCLEALFKNSCFLDFLLNHKSIIFINMYISDSDEYKKRIMSRDKGRGENTHQKNFKNILKNNKLYFDYADKFCKISLIKYKNNEIKLNLLNVDNTTDSSKLIVDYLRAFNLS